MAATNPRNRVIAIVIVVIVVAVLGWAATQWGPFASKVAENQNTGSNVANTQTSGPLTAEPAKPEAKTAKAETCDVVLRGMRAEIVGHPDAVIFKATGPAVQFLSAKPVDKSATFKLTNIKIDGGKAVSVDKPSGKFDLVVQAKSMTPVQLAAEAKCGGGK